MFGIDDAIGAALNIGNTLIDRLIPNPAQAAQAKQALATMQQNGELAKLTAVTDLAKAQLSVDQAEAASGNSYAQDARPTIMYICGAVLAWNAAIGPFLGWFSTLIGHPLPYPTLDNTLTGYTLAGMLGLGGAVTYENVKGPSK